MNFKLKINTGLNDKDKKLIVIALTVLILLGGWQFFLKPKYDDISDFKDEMNKNIETRDELARKYSDIKDYKKTLKLYEYKISNLKEIIPEYLYTEDVMVAANNLAKVSSINLKGGNTVTELTPYQAKGTETVGMGFYKRDVGLNVEGSYRQIIDFLKLIYASRLNMVVNDVNISSANNGKMAAVISFSVYTYNPTGRLPEIVNNGGVLPQGDFTGDVSNAKPNQKSDASYNNVIGYGSARDTVIKNSKAKGKIDVSKIAVDFYCIIRPYKDDAPSVTLGKYPDGYTEISSDGTESSDVTLNIQKSNGKYYYSYNIDGKENYPEAGEKEFKPSSKKLIFNVISSKRIDGDDKTGIKLDVENNSDLEVMVNVVNDDKANSRVNISKSVGKYSIVNH